MREMERIRRRTGRLPPTPSAESTRMSGFVRMRQTAREWRMKTWYCVLFNSHVCWFASKRDAQVAARLQGQAHVAGARACAGAGRIHVYPHAFEFTARNGRVFFCSAPTEDEQQRWVESLNAVPHHERASSTGSLTLSSGSDSIGSNSSLPALECPTEKKEVAAPLLGPSLSSGGPDSVSFRRARTTGRLELSARTPSDSACYACDAEFGALRRRRHACGGCARSFCRWHCANSVILDVGDAAGPCPARVCDACALLQRFTAFAVALTAAAHSRPTPSTRSFHDCFRGYVSNSDSHSRDVVEPWCHRRQWQELRLVTASPASFTALNLMCVLHKYQRAPWLFARALCLFIPVFETDPAALAEYWVQFLGLFVPLVESAHPAAPESAAAPPPLDSTQHRQQQQQQAGAGEEEDGQQASLALYMDVTLAICRRSTWFALRTVWECLALYDDAQQRGRCVCANYVLLLIYLVSAFDGDSEVVANSWLRDAPERQADALVCAMDALLHARETASRAAPRTLVGQWIHATHADDLQLWTQRVVAVMTSDAAADDRLPSSSLSNRILALFSPVVAEGEALYDAVVGGVSDAAAPPPAVAAQLRPTRSRQERVFNAEINFVHNLTAIAERLRHVSPVSARPAALPELLRRLQQTLGAGAASMSNVQFLPLLHDATGDHSSGRSGAPTILRVLPDEGKVFSTRCRAPTLVVFEALAPLGPLPASAADKSDADAATPSADTTATVSTMKPPSRPALGRQDSEMLDRMLCSFDKKQRPFDDEQREDSLLERATGSDSDCELGEDDADADAAENEAPPVALSTEDARLVYEESTAATMLATDGAALDGASAETWEVTTRRVQAASDLGELPGWTLVSVIAKSFDDVRQEVFALQLMSTLQGILDGNGLGHLYLRPYKILCTGANAGLIETLTDAFSLDAVKKQHGSLGRFFAALFGSEHSEAFVSAQQSFVVSMAASSVFCYLFQLFRQLFVDAMLAVRREYVKLLSLIHLTVADSPFPCFQTQSPDVVLNAFRRRLFLEHADDAAATALLLRLMDKSYNHWGMRQYDYFQKSTNGILP
ncbi:hypothetical protein PybrP1_004500 [[Pythium] brassicae (nom. inval.)]|nr:hypothetical protein PybrP1_004500 [[Pythium] brassicae (nom. inval.)]